MLAQGEHIAADIRSFFEDPTSSPLSEAEVDAAIELVSNLYKDGLDHWVRGRPHVSGRSPISASSATKCVLASWFKHNQFPTEPFNARTNATFRMGDLVERDLYLAAILSGAKVEHFQRKAPIVRNGWPTTNYIDWISTSPVDGKRRVVDCKTQSSYGFDRTMREGVDDTFGYVGQMSNYVDWAYKEKLTDVKEGIFLLYKKDTGHIGEVVCKLDKGAIELSENNARIVMEHSTYKKCDECGDAESLKPSCQECKGFPVVDVGAADDRRPDRPAEMAPKQMKDGTWKLGLKCTYCNYKFSCWTYPQQRVELRMSDHGNPVPTYAEVPRQSLAVTTYRGKPQFHVVKR